MEILGVLSLNLFAYLTIRLRPKLYETQLFRPMILNFKLSLLPLIIMQFSSGLFILLAYISSMTGQIAFRYLGVLVASLGFIVWILMLPNSGYLITELNLTHRDQDQTQVPIWYDIVSIMAFALSGIVNTMVNINMVQILILIYFDPDHVDARYKLIFFILALIINFLVAVGIYLGRSIRFNSWDILRPVNFIKIILEHFKQKANRKNFILFVSFHAIFFQIVYALFGGI